MENDVGPTNTHANGAGSGNFDEVFNELFPEGSISLTGDEPPFSR